MKIFFALFNLLFLMDIAYACDAINPTNKPLPAENKQKALSQSLLNDSQRSLFNFYVGVISNYDFGKSQIFVSQTGTDTSTSSSMLSLPGLGGGLIAGINKYFGQFLIGLEGSAEVNSGHGKESHTFPATLNQATITTQSNVRKKDAYSLSIRGGYQWTDNTLIYARIGATTSKYQVKIMSNDNFSTFAKINKNFIGPTAALGTEIKITEGVLGRVEFSHTHYQKKNVTYFNGQTSTNRLKFTPQSNKITVGIVVPLNN